MNKTALITGATSGIGLETSKILAYEGFNLIITGRRQDRLNNLKNEIEKEFAISVLTLCYDIRKLNECENAINSIPENWKNIDVLVNNAGLAAGLDNVNSGRIEDWEQMIDTNIKGLLYMTRLVANIMIDNKNGGQIINISSIAGREIYPLGNVYCGTKHAVNAISRSLRIELLPYKIKVGTVSPGAVETEFSLIRFKGDKAKADEVYKGITPLSAKDIAIAIQFIVNRPAHVNIDDIFITPTAQGSIRDMFRQL